MYAIVDIETSGGKFNEEGITEIAIYKYDGDSVVDQLISLVNPEKKIQPFVVQLTGINDQMVQRAPKFHEIAKRIVEITQDCVLVAHNAQFDYRILKNCFHRLGYNYNRKTICTVELAKKLIPDQESYSLGKLVKSLGIPISNRHRADGDAIATLKLFKLLLNKDQELGLFHQLTKSEEHGLLSSKQMRFLDRLPNKQGYIKFFDKEDQLIYLLKNDNLYKALSNFFISESTLKKKIYKSMRDIEFTTIDSNFMVDIQYANTLFKQRPKFNRRPKKGNELTPLENYENKEVILLDKGRTLGEKSLFYINKGLLVGYGFCELNIQYTHPEILGRILTQIEPNEHYQSLLHKHTSQNNLKEVVLGSH